MASCIARLRITADDVGAISSIDEAVKKLVEIKIINSISVLINGTCNKSWILQSTRDVVVGLHLTFSFGTPLSVLPCSSGLVDTEGNFIMPEKPYHATKASIRRSIDGYFSRFSIIPQSYLEQEVKAQYHAFVEEFGTAPDFINVHHDLDICENLKRVLTDLFPELPSRALLDKDENFYLFDFLDESEPFQKSEERVVLLIKEGIKKRFIDNKDGEVVFHPAYSSKELEVFSAYSMMREREYSILSSDLVIAMLYEGKCNAIERNILSG